MRLTTALLWTQPQPVSHVLFLATLDLHTFSEPHTHTHLQSISLSVLGELLQHEFAAARLLENERTCNRLIGALLECAHPDTSMAGQVLPTAALTH